LRLVDHRLMVACLSRSILFVSKVSLSVLSGGRTGRKAESTEAVIAAVGLEMVFGAHAAARHRGEDELQIVYGEGAAVHALWMLLIGTLLKSHM